jgi:hypothetical protein
MPDAIARSIRISPRRSCGSALGGRVDVGGERFAVRPVARWRPQAGHPDAATSDEAAGAGAGAESIINWSPASAVACVAERHFG